MNYNYLNIYNNLIKLTRNKNLYLYLEKNDTFSDRLVFLFFHFALFLKRNQNATKTILIYRKNFRYLIYSNKAFYF